MMEFFVLGVFFAQLASIRYQLEYSRGDMNYDGKIDIVDLSILSSVANSSV